MKRGLETAARTGRIDDFFGAGDGTLTRVEIPSGVEEVGQGAFSRLPNLVSADLPDSVHVIGACAFQGCPSLEEIRLSGDLREMRGAFSDTPRLSRIGLGTESRLRLEGAMLFRGNTLLRVFASLLEGRFLRIPAGVESIAGGALAGCTDLESVALPDGLQEIGSGAFSGCRSLAKLVLPGTLRRIGGNAFAGDSALEELVLPDAVEEVGEWCCDGCISLRRVEIPGGLRYPANAFPAICRRERRGDFRPHAGAPIDWKTPVIPPYAFSESLLLDEVTLPDTVTQIGDGAFQQCPRLHTIHLPKGLKLLGRNAFACLPLLEEIDLPDGIAEIPQGCFWNCTALRRVKLPASLRTINRHAFRDCRLLEKIEFPARLGNIVSGAFLGCTALRRVELPESLTTLGSGDYLTPAGEFPGAFENCESLREALLPSKLDLLNDWTFSGCLELQHVRMPAELARCGKNVFAGCPENLLLDTEPVQEKASPGWVEEILNRPAPKIGFLFALVDEAEPFARRFGAVAGLVPRRILGIGHHRLLVCGSGRANAAAGTIRLAREGCQIVVNIGLCGGQGVDGKTRVFMPRICWDGDAYVQNPGEALLDPAGVNAGREESDAPPVFTVSGFAERSPAPRAALVDNEAYAVAATADALGIRRVFVKIVSDCADVHALEDFRIALRTIGDHVDAAGTMLLAELNGEALAGGEERP